MNRKGQLWSLDFTAGMLILAVILLLFIFLWNTLSTRWGNASQSRQMEQSALFASEALVATSGEPESWEMLSLNSTSAIGLANGRSELNDVKIKALVAANSSSYDFVRNRLGLEKYDVGIRITDLSRATTYYQFGKFSGQLNSSFALERIAMLNGSAVIVYMEVWK